MIDHFYFLVRHTPFWAVPVLVISLEFGLVFFVKNRKNAAKVFWGIAFFAFSAMVYYFVAGGPERSVKYLLKYFN